jgi:hypothetical protein
MSAVNKLFIEDIDVAAKRVIVRVDFNVPSKMGRSKTTSGCGLRCPPSHTCASKAPR